MEPIDVVPIKLNTMLTDHKGMLIGKSLLANLQTSNRLDRSGQELVENWLGQVRIG